MTDHAAPASLRASALALLADGNHPESVAQVLGVPIEQLRQWQQGAPDAPAVAPHEAAATAGRPRAIEFDTELAYQHPLAARLAMAAMGLFMIGVLLALEYSDRHAADVPPAPGVLVIISLFTLAMLGPVVLSNVRWRFLFGRRGLTERRAFGTSGELAYADITRATIARDTQYLGRGARAPGWRLRFESAVRVDMPDSLFVFDIYALDPAIVERLRTLPGLSARDLAPLLDLPVRRRRWAPKWFGGALLAALLAVGIGLQGQPWTPLRQLWRGQPALTQMTHVSGELLGYMGCRRDPLVDGRAVDATLRLDDGHTTHAWIPCVMSGHVFADHQRHRLAIDTWQDGVKPPVVYQVLLDDHALLSYDTVRGQQTAMLPLTALMQLLSTALWLWALVAIARLFDDERWARD